MSNSILSTENVTFSYGSNVILENVNIDIKQGDFMGIVGPNGSGKSTLLKVCLGLIKPDKGKIKLFDTELPRFKNWASIGYIPQKATAFNQAFPATVEEVITANLFSQLGFAKRVKKEHKDKVDEVLDIVNMKDYKRRLIGKLSGGQQQRIFIAKALISEPKVIFMDEPTVGIDRASEESFYELMELLNTKKNITLVMVTHDIGAISNKVNRIICLSEGKIIEHDLKQGCTSEVCESIYGYKDYIPVVHSH